MTRELTQEPLTVTQGNVTLKIYEVNRGRRTIFSVAHKEDGKRQMKQFSDIESALKWATARAKAIDRGKPISITLSQDEGLIYQRAKRMLAGRGKPLDELVREYLDATKILGEDIKLEVAANFYAERRLRLTQRTVPEVVDELLTSRGHKSETHQKDLKGRLGRFARDVSSYIANISQRDLTEWLQKLRLSPRSHDNFRQVLVLLFRFAQKQGYLPEGRTEAEKTEAIGDNGEGEIGVFTPDEMSRMLNSAGEDVLPYLILGGFAGVRTAEILRLDWQEINFQTGHIEIKKKKAKTKGRRLIPIQPNLAAWLLKSAKASGPVTRLARPEKSAGEVVAAHCDPIIPWKRNGLRHSFCTYRMAVLQNEHQVSAEMGNSPAMVFANYRALATHEQGEEWFNILPQ